MKYKTAAHVLLILTAVFGILRMSQNAYAAGTITVNNITDSLADDGQCSLREAVIAANTDTATGGCPAGNGADVIVFDPALSTPAVFTLTLTGVNEDNAETGDLDLTGILTIQGDNANQIIIDGNGTDRIFDIRPGATVIISGITVRNGNPGNGSNGGGILITGGTPRAKLTLTSSIVLDNTAVIGGGIQNAGNGATAIIQNTQITSNSAATFGGGIANSGDLTLLNSTLAQNQARSGGGIEHSGIALHLTNDTISNNTASDNGGGFYNRADAIILNVTMSGNLASGPDTGGNIFNDNASMAIKNSILANSAADGNCFNSDGILTSQGFNLVSGNSCGFNGNGDIINTDPLLGQLQDNGGITFTHALAADSPAIDKGTNSGCPATDQRGFSRPADGDGNGTMTCDIGAYELNKLIPTVTPSLTPPSPVSTATPVFTTPTSVPPVAPCSSAVIILFMAVVVFSLRIR